MGNLDVTDPAIHETLNKVVDAKGETTGWFCSTPTRRKEENWCEIKWFGWFEGSFMFAVLQVGAEDRKAVTLTRCKTALITWIGEGLCAGILFR